ncbi:MAG: tryptophan synthase subunit alpha [Verrucomicrobia bacterium]|nr:tryptophan synthase subunit alpha [Verrucomicrobiota bacterium]
MSAPNRIDDLFLKLRGAKRKALIAYIVAGDPDLETTAQLVPALAEAGADLIELGVPFSDPLADGIVNQLGCQRALESGTTLPKVLQLISRLRKEKCTTPIVLFTYYNPVFAYGREIFEADATRAGADGLLLLDLPPEEAVHDLPAPADLRRIVLIAPTTPEARLRSLVSQASGFVYYVSREGVTGMQKCLPSSLGERVALLRKSTPLPICVGFGISNSEQAGQVATLADGVVVGSAIVDRIGKLGRSPGLISEVSSFLRPISQAVHSA